MGFLIADAVTGGAPDYAGMATDQENRREQRINQGRDAITRAYAGFTPDFYNKRKQAYIDFALPQLAQQYQDTSRQVSFDLENRGIGQSGAAEQAWSKLADQMTASKQGIVDTGTAQAQDLKKQVENSRDANLNLLYQSADPAGAGAAAVSTAASFATPSTFAPIANQFSNLINQYYTSQLINNFRGTSPVIVPNIQQEQTGAPTGPSQLSVGGS